MLYQAELLPRCSNCKSVRQLKFAPAELSRSFSPMTIRAANVAFVDFFQDRVPRSAADHPGDLVGFLRRLSVIEVENERVGLTAIDAGMVEKVRENSLVVLRADPTTASVSLCQVFRTVPGVVFATVCGHACETGRTALSKLFVLERKHREWFDQTARATLLFGSVCGLRKSGLPIEIDESRPCVSAPTFASPAAPVELKSGPPAMAVRAANVAFRDLSDYANP